jgi:CO/xanthine dehydrogenase Mo-binding subunit
MNIQISRRKLLKSTGALVVSFSLAGKAGQALAQGTAAAAKPVALTEVDSFLAIDKAGMVTLYTGKVDLGTGIRTALAQIAAEELDVPFKSVTLVTGDTMLSPDQGKTWASVSIQVGGIQIRNAAATARNALLDEAAKKLDVKRDDLTVADGVVSGGGKKITYAQLIGGKSFAMKVNDKVQTKDPKAFKLVGKSVARVDIPDKVTGRFTYMQDFRVAGMMHGRVIRPPAYGAKLEMVDESSVKNIPGVQVVKDNNFLGVVASSEWNAIRAARQLKAKWSEAANLPDQAKLWDFVRSTKVVQNQVTSDTGNTQFLLASDGKKVSATYDFAVNLHGSIGPSCAIADFKDGKLTSWSASQATHDLRKQLAQMFSMPAENVRCIYLEGAGCYGRNGHEDAAGDAAILAKAVGKPVRVQWSRADEHAWEPMGPPTLIDMRAALDPDNNVTSWEGDFYIPQQTAGSFLVPLTGAVLAGMPQKDDIAPGNVFQNSAIQYKFPSIKTVCKRLENTVFRPSWIRTPGRMQNTYANECFMDELAAEAKADPIAFRKKYLDDKRGLELIERLAALSKWQTRPSPDGSQSGDVLKGRGMSYVKYELTRTYVGSVADVEVNRTTGKVRVPRFYLVQDCGQLINPDGVKAQLDGNIIQTLSRTLIEEVKWNRSMVTTLDWASYPIITFPDVPELVYDLIDRPNERPWGAGEPAAAVVPSAIANAVFDATGVRMRSVPFTPAKVKAALGTAA